jgi:carbonic anhydrase/acetyltransferase-like protein (isoleucine patch superfamily)
VWYLRKKGCSIGNETKFHGRKNVDLTRPELIDIGDNVTITDDVWLLTHSHDWSVLRNYYKDPIIIGSAGKITINNNVFIGTRAIILMGVTINENSIIAAGSVVVRDVPANTLVGGVPAKEIRSLDQHYKHRKHVVKSECFDYACVIYNKYGTLHEGFFNEFFPLFKGRTEELTNIQKRQLAISIENYKTSQPFWDGIKDLEIQVINGAVKNEIKD